MYINNLSHNIYEYMCNINGSVNIFKVKHNISPSHCIKYNVYMNAKDINGNKISSEKNAVFQRIML